MSKWIDFSYKQRARHLDKLENEEFDLLIVGGGITGAGVARDAASRGMKVGLIEMSDFAEGTSSRSSKLIHGGIRYLEYFEFGLVFEALSERRILFEIAPHLVHPLRFILPVYKGARVGFFKLGLGMWLYDLLSLFEAPEMHQKLTDDESVERLPFLDKKGLQGSYAYYDAYMDDDRLVFETLRSAEEFGACSVNFVEAVSPIWSEEKNLTGLVLKDHLSGRTIKARARHIISSVGPWTDQLGEILLPDWKKMMRPSKGIHITIRRDRLPMSDAVVMVSDDQKRIVFGIPRHEMIIIGTTDTDFDLDPRHVQSEEKDIRYLLEVVNDHFPGAHLTAQDIVASYSGVRPLVHDGSESESATSREHLIFTDRRGLTVVAGGKYTTYRAMSEETVNSALTAFSLEEQVKFGRPLTKQALNPLATPEIFSRKQGFVGFISQKYEIPEDLAAELFDRHGEEAEHIGFLMSQIEESSLLLRRWKAELIHAVNTTMCLRLVDFYLRRTPLFLSEFDHGFQMADELVRCMGTILNWSPEEIDEQLGLLESHVKKEMGWRKALFSH